MTPAQPEIHEQDLGEFYHDGFYVSQHTIVLRSARIYIEHLWRYLQPEAVLDVGCGRGAWLKACGELGAEKLIGIDGHWNNASDMLDDRIDFRHADLNTGFRIREPVDLVMSLEVAEHLPETSAQPFVECLTAACDIVLFSAAFQEQGGKNHLNEQPHSYWARKFLELGYAPFDLFRPFLWANDDVAFWYRQNVFAYARRGSSPHDRLGRAGFREVENIDFMDCIHPARYIGRSEHPPDPVSFRTHVGDLLPSILRSVKARISAR